jgi:hypothetical protein
MFSALIFCLFRLFAEKAGRNQQARHTKEKIDDQWQSRSIDAIEAGRLHSSRHQRSGQSCHVFARQSTVRFVDFFRKFARALSKKSKKQTSFIANT